MSAFREFEHAGWEDPATCAAYHNRLGAVVAQSVDSLLDAAGVAEPDQRRDADAAGATEPRRVLDVATGAGGVAAAAARRGAVVIGVDFSAEQLRRARAEHAGLGFVRGDAGALPLADATVDVVVSNFGVLHFPDPEASFREAARVLWRTGRLAFTVWAPPARSPVFAALFAALARHGSLDVGLPPGPDFFRYTDPATAALDLTAAGFADVSVTDVAQTWRLPNAADAVDGLLHGTVRMGALLRRQPIGVLDRVRQAVAEQLAPYDGGGATRIPMPAVVVRAAKP